MKYGNETDEQGAKFKSVILPPGFLEDPKNENFGVTIAEPEVDVTEHAPRDERRQFDPSAGRETWNRKLRPRHRQVVGEYFDNDE